MEAWVLTKRCVNSQDQESLILGVYMSQEALEDRLRKIKSANKKYPLRAQITAPGVSIWHIGPEDDQGFFGDQLYELKATRTEAHQ